MVNAGSDHETLREPESVAGDAIPAASVRPYLALVLECDRPGMGGARYSLAHVDKVIVGRGPERSHLRTESEGKRVLKLSLPGQYISGSHAQIECVDGRWVVQDLGSTNGSFVNGMQVQSQQLFDGDIVELGRGLFVFRAAARLPEFTQPDEDSLQARWAEPGLATLVPTLAAEFRKLADVARAAIPIVLVGPTGTGKEVTARTIHALSKRTGHMVAVNCGAIAGSLLESLLFGHVRGAFSGAVRDEIELVRASHEGTLFLDEIASLPAPGQVALLRVLQEGEVVPLGRSQPIRVDRRVVAASHEPLQSLVERGLLREDLAARLLGFSLQLPPLAERVEDLGILIGAVLQKHTAGEVCLSPNAARLLCTYEWPRNIRELEQLIRVALATQTDGRIRTSHLPQELLASPKQSMIGASMPPKQGDSGNGASDDLRSLLVTEMQRCSGNVSKVARAMKRSRAQIHRWLARFELTPEDFRGEQRAHTTR